MFATSQLNFMRGVQEARMQDKCKIGARVNGLDAYGKPSAVITWGSEIACGLDMREGFFKRGPIGEGVSKSGAGLELVNYDARLRVAHDTIVKAGDQVKITERFCSDITPEEIYEVMGPPETGPSGMRLILKKVEL